METIRKCIMRTGSSTFYIITLFMLFVAVGCIQVRPNEPQQTCECGSTKQFEAKVIGLQNKEVSWSIDEGDECGTISVEGLYTSPDIMPSPSTATVRATSVAKPNISGTAKVIIIGGPIVIGELDGPCYANGTCNTGLICVDDICEEKPIVIGELGGLCYEDGTCNTGLICVDDICEENPIPIGELGGPCYEDGTCNTGLICVDDICEEANVDPATPGYNVLGCGTDIFQEYSVESNVKGRVLDITMLNVEDLLVLNPLVEERYFEKISGKSIDEYASKLSASVGVEGSYMYFSASIKTSFTNETYKKAEYSYTTIMETNWKNSLKIQNDRWYAAYLKDYLTPEAMSSINNDDLINWSGEDIIKSYGTHVMVGVYAGARLDYHLAINIKSQEHDTDLEAFASARFDGMYASAGITASIDSETFSAMEKYERKETIYAKGGDSQYANPANDDDYKLWHESISTNPVFCGIIQYALIPIWEFADTEERQAEIEAAYITYAEGKSSDFEPILPTFSKITDIKLINTGSSSSVTLDPGWALIQDIDGNTSNGGINGSKIWRGSTTADYVWLAFKEELTDQPGLEEIHILSNDDPLNVDLFDGQTHDNIYGVDSPGCSANASVDLNSNTCATGYNNEYYSTCCIIYYWNPKCNAENDLELYFHYVQQQVESSPITAVVLGNYLGVDDTQDLETRKQNISWGPADANKDGAVDGDDAAYVLEKVQWVKKESDGELVNLNWNTQSYKVWNWDSCSWLFCSDRGWDSGYIHAYEALGDAQYIGYCVE